jgi:hypothetical protein
MQMICALLVFQTPRLPAPLAELSPWLDWLVLPRDQVVTNLEAQQHRRFVKTHTPLDGVPLDPRATYVVVARHPLDAAVSLYHQGDNLDHGRIGTLVGAAPPEGPPAPRPALRDWLLSWIDSDADPREELDSLPGFCWHLSDAWSRRNASNVILVHYDDLSRDLDEEMRRLAEQLEIDVPQSVWPDLVAAAGFDAMRADAARLAPDPAGVLKDPAAFFRRGRSGAGRELLDREAVQRYEARMAELTRADLLGWLHRIPPS